jgi:hypothetical protein
MTPAFLDIAFGALSVWKSNPPFEKCIFGRTRSW